MIGVVILWPRDPEQSYRLDLESTKRMKELIQFKVDFGSCERLVTETDSRIA